jgi:hypothetical protein
MRIIVLLCVVAVVSPAFAGDPKVQRGIPYAEPRNERFAPRLP